MAGVVLVGSWCLSAVQSDTSSGGEWFDTSTDTGITYAVYSVLVNRPSSTEVRLRVLCIGTLIELVKACLCSFNLQSMYVHW